MKGEVKFFKQDKGFGFIKVNGQKDVFFHKSDLYGKWEPEEGDYVEFDVRTTDRGQQADNVVKI